MKNGMQLAATQRPHAPPVPPRPSRQVVAEALKRSPKPLCPTRQAPPPPNTKPWRAQEKENGPNPSGRTIIYESTRDKLDRHLIEGENNKDVAPEFSSGIKNLERTVRPPQNNASNKERYDGKPMELHGEMPHKVSALPNKVEGENNIDASPELPSISKNFERTVKLNYRPQQHRIQIQSNVNNEGQNDGKLMEQQREVSALPNKTDGEYKKVVVPDFSFGLKNVEKTVKIEESDADSRQQQQRQTIEDNKGRSDGKLIKHHKEKSAVPNQVSSYSKTLKTEINEKCNRVDSTTPMEFPDDINPLEYNNIARKRFSLVESDQISCNSLSAVQTSESSPFHDRAITVKPPIPVRPNSTGDETSSIPNFWKSTDSKPAKYATKAESRETQSETTEQKLVREDGVKIKGVPLQCSSSDKNLERTATPQRVGVKNENNTVDRQQLPTPHHRYLTSSSKSVQEHRRMNPSTHSNETLNQLPKHSRPIFEKQSQHQVKNGDFAQKLQDPHQRFPGVNRSTNSNPLDSNGTGCKRPSPVESDWISSKPVNSESSLLQGRAIPEKQQIPAMPNSSGDETNLVIQKSIEYKADTREGSEIKPEKNVQESAYDAKRPHRPTPSQRSRTKMEPPQALRRIADQELVKSSVGQENLANKTISSDDCTTVVVMDEPERKVAFEDNVNIHHQDWLEAGIRYSSTQITLPGDDFSERVNGIRQFDDEFNILDFSSIREKIAMSSLQGLPPLPRSLSGFNLSGGREGSEPPPPPARSSSKCQRGARNSQPGTRSSPPARQLTTLDTQLAVLRREMFGLRQLDLSLLSQLWSLNESIQEFRQLLQEQEDRAPSPSPSSEEGDDTSYDTHPPPPPRRPPPVTHHHRQPRPSPRNESPSSEEYGAV